MAKFATVEGSRDLAKLNQGQIRFRHYSNLLCHSFITSLLDLVNKSPIIYEQICHSFRTEAFAENWPTSLVRSKKE